MSVLALALTHRTACLADLERVAIPRAEVEDVTRRLLAAPGVAEAVALPTCLRSEVYAWADDPEAAAQNIRLILDEVHGLPLGWTDGRSELLIGEDAVRHLFLVTAGLESIVPGEEQIQGQVKEVFGIARDIHSVGRHLDPLFRWALEAGKKARSSTALAAARRSMSQAAAEAIARLLGELAGTRILVVGTGKMAALAIPVLRDSGAEVGVVTKRMEVAKDLALELGVSALPVEQLGGALERADAAMFATVAPHFVLTQETGEKVARGRHGRRPLLIIDLGLPRNVDPRLAGAEGLDVYDLERLNAEGYTAAEGWEEELEKARALALEEAASCAASLRALSARDLVSRIHGVANEVAAAEVERALKKAPRLEPEERAAVESAVTRAMRKLIHLPTVRAKEAAAQGDEAVLEAARWLFGVSDRDADFDGEEAHR